MSLSLHPEASASGKVILLGEHAVVHGEPALAAGLPRALTLSATPLADPLAPMTLSVPLWDLDLVLEPRQDHPVARACLEVLAHCDGPVTGWAIRGVAQIPARAGLGSSAALGVALARLVLGPNAAHEDVVAGSLAGERVFHGDPSGVDSEVAARGGILRFIRGQAPESIPLQTPLSLVLVPSGVPRNTADQVARVRHNIDRWPIVARPLIGALGRATDAALAAIFRNDLDELGALMNLAHGVLGGLGVSSWILDELCYIARGAGARGAKLTGAGGGGCILALPGESRSSLAQAFRDRGLSPLEVEIQP